MTLDANIVVAFLNGEEKIIAQLTEWREEGRPLLLPTVAEAEVLGYPHYSPEERENAARLIAENFVPLVCDRIFLYARNGKFSSSAKEKCGIERGWNSWCNKKI